MGGLIPLTYNNRNRVQRSACFDSAQHEALIEEYSTPQVRFNTANLMLSLSKHEPGPPLPKYGSGDLQPPAGRLYVE